MKLIKSIYICILFGSVPLLADAQIDTSLRVIDLGFNIKTSEKNNTAAISIIYPSKFTSSATNPGNALYGTAAGLFVKQGTSVAWSNDPSINIRGISTLNNNAPLVLIDGFERSLNTLDQEEIESISVIKDGAALALYGLRGANGVVSVTTKRGSDDKMGIKVTYQTGKNKPFRLPKFANAYAYANAMNEALALDGLALKYSQSDLDAFRTKSNPELFPDVDWVGEGIRDEGFTNQLTTSFKGGGEKMKYYTMVSYINDSGFIKPGDMNPDYKTQMGWNRLSARTNLDMVLTKTTDLKVSLLGQIAEHKRPAINFPVLFNTLYSVPSAAFPIRTSSNIIGGNYINLNPIGEITERGYASGNDRTLMADLRLTQDLSAWAEGLSAELALAYDNKASYWDANNKNYLSESLLAIRNSDGSIANVTRTKYGQESALSFSSSLGLAAMMTAFDGKISYEKSWDNESQLHSSVAFRMDEMSQNGRNNTYRRQNIIGNAEYSLKNKYILNLAMSYAGSSVLTEGDKFRFFPAVSAAWILSNEDFMSSASAINQFKLRASWGKSGSDRFAYELDRQYYLLGGSSYFFGANNAGASGNVEGVLANSQLDAEMSYKTNLGLDLKLFNHITLNADVFYDKRKNILVPSSSLYSSAIGIGTSLVNDGEVKNYGVEATLEWAGNTRNWNYNIGGNFSFSRNEILNMNEDYRPEAYLQRSGHSIGQYFGLESIGYFKDESDINNSPAQTFSQLRPGDIKYKDKNNDNVINEYDEIAVGYSTLIPEIYYGLNIGFGYKGLGFRAQLQGVANFSVVKNMSGVYWPLLNNTTVSDHYLSNRWTPEQPDAEYPRLTTLDNKNNYHNNTTWLENGAFLKLRSIEFNYTVPQKLTQQLKMSEVKLFVRGANLFSLDHVKNLDPEQMFATYPSFKSYYLGINLSF